MIFRVVSRAQAARSFPAALAIVVQTFESAARAGAGAVLQGIAGGLTAIGPLLGGYLTEWTWRGIFWVNIPVALIALALIFISKPVTEYKAAPMDYRGLVLIAAGVALSVFAGFQQSNIWGWSNPLIWLSIAAGLALLVVFYFVERRTVSPLMQVGYFENRAFRTQCLVLFTTNLVFIPVFFFGSEYAQISLSQSAQQAGVILLYFFIGFVIASQIGGRMLDRVGAKRPVVLGCALGAVGFYLWAGKVTGLGFGAQQWCVVSCPGRAWASCSARRAPTRSTGPSGCPTVRRPASPRPCGTTPPASVWPSSARSRSPRPATTCLQLTGRAGRPSRPTRINPRRPSSPPRAQGQAGSAQSAPYFKVDFAQSTETVLYVMAAIMAVAAIIGLIGLRAGVQELEPEAADREASQAPAA